MTRSDDERSYTRPEPFSFGRLALEILNGAQSGHRVVAEGDTFTVGSAPTNDLVVHDPTVSRFHFELRRVGDQILLTDNGSLNGTQSGGVFVARGMVSPGAILMCGRVRLRVEHGDPVNLETHEDTELNGVHGRSIAMRRVMAQVKQAAKSDASVLIQGETGVGKEVIARTLHEMSDRRERPFEVVDCGTLHPDLIASDLFGHEQGAFTGAQRDRRGAFERAHGGTLFLDEIGEIPTSMQVALLGALERRKFRRVGGEDPINVDVRIISATNRDLRERANSVFRPDLYFRLAVVRLFVPPLRERLEDVEILVHHFLREMGIDDESRAADIISAVDTHNWPGNVRELRNFVEAAVALGEPPDLEPSPNESEDTLKDIDEPRPPDPVDPRLPASINYKEARSAVLAKFERRYLQTLLARTRGNVSKAARVGGINRSYLRQLIARHGINPSAFE